MWDEGMLTPVAEINELMLGLMRSAAAEARPGTPRLIAELRPLWLASNEATLQRLAHSPFLLLDAGFAAPERWEQRGFDGSVREGSVRDGAAVRGYFAGTAGAVVVRHALVLAHYLARTQRLTARVLLGIAPDCAERIVSRTLRELEWLAEQAPPWIAPRWEAQPAVWRQMLEAALTGQEAPLRRVQTRGLQLMATLW